MKFAQFMTPTGKPVYLSANFIVMHSIDRGFGTLIVSAVGRQEVQQELTYVLQALEAID